MTAVTLTFDNGPDEVATPRILETLARAGVLATFFVVGSRVTRAGHKILARAAGEGHLLGNHTWTHSGPLGDMTPRAALDEIVRTQDLLGRLSGSPPLFRPVGGGEGGIIDDLLLRAECVDHLVAHGYSVVLWNVVPRDWLDPDGWVERALTLSADTDEACIVLHDVPAADRLADFLARLRDRGVDFVQEAPDSCTPIRAGRVVADLTALVRS